MTLKSMTGFARSEGKDDTAHWHWEVRSVNGRGLDVRVRVPTGLEDLEPVVRQACAKRFARGNCTINLHVRRATNVTGVRLNETVYEQVRQIAQRLCADTKVPALSAESLLNIKGVLEYVETDDDEEGRNARNQAMLHDLDVALKAAAGARQEEGERLKTVVQEQVDRIEELVSEVEVMPERGPEFLRQRVRDSVTKLMDANSKLDEGRLHQEAALLVAKVDVEEELKRLRMHIGSARELLENTEPVGRRLDFLAQEFNREANTLCSKAHVPDVTRLGLELKAVIDQMREQVQNIE